MPAVASFDGIRIELYFDDHPPPHFHARYSGSIVVINIKTMDTIAGSLPPGKLRSVLNWARHRQEALLAAWYQCRIGAYPEAIP